MHNGSHILQLMAVTLNLEIGRNVQLLVEKVLKQEQELVQIQPQLTVEQIVLGNQLRHDLVNLLTAQVTI